MPTAGTARSVGSFNCPWVSDSVLVCWPLNTPWIEEDENGLLSMPRLTRTTSGGSTANYSRRHSSGLQTTGPGLYAVSVTDFELPRVIEDWLVVEVLESASTAGTAGWCTPIPRRRIGVDLPIESKAFNLQVVTMNGVLVETGSVHSGMSLDVGHWASGTYILRVQSQHRHVVASGSRHQAVTQLLPVNTPFAGPVNARRRWEKEEQRMLFVG